MNRCLSISCVLILALTLFARAGETQFSDKNSVASRDIGFLRGTHELEISGGAFWYLNYVTRTRPEIDYAITSVRFGWMLDDLRSGLFGGNEEFLLEAFGGTIFEGPGDLIGGATLILRHNFVWRQDAVFVPYFQIGAGGVYTDISDNNTQVSVGLPVEFNLQTSLGARIRINRSWSINAEFEYRHISNAGIDSRNGGVDTGGFLVGLGRMF